ncbi:uncharacterized protein AMSG_00142 [Thecamonas trahens ATCC 50062]|uniref:IPT/TIG domain-containing protein n=1 Tax=Thecamonas trahens ATCC 50062 TaxID=461836 RepID=A0A0L0D0W9_THETB|nr:hypothetical protein AMSG_00142 [Thecamonas trahens ATCC 50062]KNC46024.1 hypothetical protein AMSG_00142 [Thecamonas trahens ATCC 50062]|eukprot:XP_013763004.1 hypothetical protein AMSG_00142 [Thecamonas trahens ATCC 50062]
MVCDKTYVSSSLVTCLTTSFTPADYSAAQAGSLEVNVRTTSSGADGTMAAPLALALVTRTPTVSQINGAVSATGSILGGESVTLTGTDLGFGQSDVLGVWLAHQACASAAWVSSTEVVCVTPAVPDAVRGPAVVQTASSGGVNSTSPSVVEFFFRREAQSLEESISFAVGAASSLALAFYWLIALVAAVAAFSLYKRSKNKKKALEWSRFRQVSFLEKLFTDHSVLGIAYYDESHPFTRFSRIITLVLEVLVNFLSVFLVTVVAPAVYEDSEASRQLRRETNTSGDWLLSLAMGTTLSILVGKPLLQHVLETSSSNIASGSRWSHRAIAQVAASFIDLVLLAINIILCIDPGLLLTSHLTVAIDTSNLLVRFVANMLLSWVITEPLLVLLKMKVWLDTVIRTNKYTVSEPDAKASNVVKMTAFFTDRADSDESDGHGVVSVPLATAAVAADGSSSALNDRERSSKLGSLSSSSSLAGSGSGSSRRPMQPPGAASPASRAMSRSHHKQRMSSSLSSEVVVIADDATIGGSAAPTPTRTRSKRTRRSRSSDNRGGDRSTSRKAAGGLLDALPEVGTRPLQRSRSGSKAEGLRTAALNDSPLLAVQDSTPISIDAVDIADAQAVRSPVSRTKAAMARTNSLPYNSSSRTRAGRLGGAPSRRASDRDIGRRRRTTSGNQDGTAVAAARSPLTRTNSRQTDAMRSPPRLSNVDDMSTTAASQTQSPSRRGSSLSSSVPVGATSSVSPARTGSSRALRGSPSRRATAIPGSASKPAMSVSRRDSLRPSASQRRGSSPLLQSPAETQT